ncbi:MAG: DUF3768 domain-containing protein [Cyanobacteria bacterium P01_A01_bin.17]
MSETTQRIAQQNDQCRQYIMMPVLGKPAVPCRIMMTQGIASLSPEDQVLVFVKVRQYDDFAEGNDPYGERDFGSFDHNGQQIFWKIDYYDPTLTFGSEDPADIHKTIRVLTIMLAEEY